MKNLLHWMQGETVDEIKYVFEQFNFKFIS